MMAAALAVVFALALSLTGLWQWVHVRGWPQEQAQVLSMERTGHLQRCGKYDDVDVYTVTWRSQDPPSGLPAEFTGEEGCSAPEVGDTVTVVRVVDQDGSVHVWNNPVTSGRTVAWVFAGTFAGVFAVVWLVSAAWIAWRRPRRRRPARRPGAR